MLERGGRILHIAGLDKFIPGYVEFIRKNFNGEAHVFITFGDFGSYPYLMDSGTHHYSDFKKAISHVVVEANKSDKIIIHGLFDWRLPQIFMSMPWLHQRCNWVVWGGDLYFHQLNRNTHGWHQAERYRRPFIARLGGLITHVEGDYQRAVDWYGATGKMHECIMYASNIFSGPPPQRSPQEQEGVVLLVGNSADPTNNHPEIFDKIKGSSQCNNIVRIYCPLSYGSREYAKRVVGLGKELFADRFFALTDFIPIGEYKKLLQSIDVAIFAHNRQQAMGNIINLLGMGKKVIMREEVSSWDGLNDLGVEIFPFHEMDISPLEESVAMHNYKIIAAYFSDDNLVNQWKEIFAWQG